MSASGGGTRRGAWPTAGPGAGRRPRPDWRHAKLPRRVKQMRRGGGRGRRPVGGVGGRVALPRGGAIGPHRGKKHLMGFSIRPGPISGIREQQLQGQTGYAIYAVVIDQRRFAPLSFSRRGGRVVECTALEMRHRGDSIGGSNPFLSATYFVQVFDIVN